MKMMMITILKLKMKMKVNISFKLKMMNLRCSRAESKPYAHHQSTCIRSVHYVVFC